MKSKNLLVLVTVVALLVIWSYGESVVIMRGDYLFSRWIGVTETNKNWFHLFFWLIVGGTIPYIIVSLFKKRRNKKGGESEKS
jgi:hypothetical protein